jgi:Fe-S-cluster containining protein
VAELPPEHPLFRQFLDAEQVRAEDRLGFSCKGCGHLCCVNREIYLIPPEATRIVWHLLRHPEQERQLREHDVRWGEIVIGDSTGLPGGRLNFLPVDSSNPKRGTYCPFLAPVRQTLPDGTQRSVMHWCSLHTARPSPCRVFPVGVVTAVDGSGPPEKSYCIVERCPGFAPAALGEPVPPDYAPADPAQTVGDWLSGQDDRDMRTEREYYVHTVAAAFLEAGLHATTEVTSGGLLSDQEVTVLGQEHFFRAPPPPDNPGHDHETIMVWLGSLLDLITPMLRERTPAD